MKKEEALEMAKLVIQRIAGDNTVKDNITLLKLIHKQQVEQCKDKLNIEALVVCNTEMLSVITDILEKLLENEQTE